MKPGSFIAIDFHHFLLVRKRIVYKKYVNSNKLWNIVSLKKDKKKAIIH